ncbi:uncharacterized protein [Antedon mediterranea]|uniref:uncharacterized protein n=1 Tax=Antedon mediterranea TaxID=105859 RepID=UPI003AF9EE98
MEQNKNNNQNKEHIASYMHHSLRTQDKYYKATQRISEAVEAKKIINQMKESLSSRKTRYIFTEMDIGLLKTLYSDVLKNKITMAKVEAIYDKNVSIQHMSLKCVMTS